MLEKLNFKSQNTKFEIKPQSLNLNKIGYNLAVFILIQVETSFRC